MDPSCTLFSDITTLLTSPYPATSLLKHLIDFVGVHVCSLRRNTQASYRFVEHARNLCDEINKLIGVVNSQADWDAYDTYTQAINPLEKYAHILPPSMMRKTQTLCAGP
jgi:cysteine synthase